MAIKTLRQLRGELPLIWPDPKAHQTGYGSLGGHRIESVFQEADLICGLLVGVAEEALQWVDELLESKELRRVWLVLVLFPAGPTRERHLQALIRKQAEATGKGKSLEIRLLALNRLCTGDSERAVFPPTVVQAYASQSGETAMSIGSVGDAGSDPYSIGSLNFAFKPDDALRDGWRRSFQYIFSSAAPLTLETLSIPHLVPAVGSPEAAVRWQAFERACRGKLTGAGSGPAVNPTTGEVETDADGRPTMPWDGGATALDMDAQLVQRVYSAGWLVTVDESTRIKPLAIPVKATLLGELSQRVVGAVKQKQSFSLQVLDDIAERAVEKCRSASDVIDLLSYQLSLGNRWISAAARDLLDVELEVRNQRGLEALV